MTGTSGRAGTFTRLPRLAGRGLVLLYRYTLLALIGPRCRHLPSCSEYAEEAVIALRPVGRRLDGARAHPALPPLGDARARFRAGGIAAARALVDAVALRELAGHERDGLESVRLD